MEEDKNTLDLHTEVREEDRVAKAVALFKEGYNCSQSVVTAFADLYGFTREQALHMSASFGGGIGRMRETCGAACGMFLLAGLEKCAIDRISRTRASFVAQAICGVMKQFFAVSKGLVYWGGSEESTSSPAAAITPLFSASARSFSFTKGPRPVFIRMAVGFIRARRSALTSSLVSGVRGQCRLTTSHSRNSSSSSIFRIPPGSCDCGLEV